MLVGNDPAVCGLDFSADAVCAREVMDFWRPVYMPHALVDGHYSIQCYLDSLQTAYKRFRLSHPGQEDYHLFHMPFPRMASKAFRRMWEVDAEVFGKTGDFEKLYEQKVKPCIWPNELVGNSYSASLYLSLAGLLESGGSDVENADLTLFSYGSGSCSEFFQATVGPSASAWEGKIGISRGLDRRTEIDLKTYREFREARQAMAVNGSYAMVSGEPGGTKFSFAGIQDHRRVYLSKELKQNPT